MLKSSKNRLFWVIFKNLEECKRGVDTMAILVIFRRYRSYNLIG